MNYLSIAHLVQDKARSAPEFDVLTFENNGDQETRSYSQIWANSQQLARGLKNYGFKLGDHIGILLQNHPEFVEVMVASAILGLVFVPLDPRIRGEKLSFMLSNAKCRSVICGDYALEDVWAVRNSLPDIDYIFVVGKSSLAEQNRDNNVIPLMSLYNFNSSSANTSCEVLPISVTRSDQPMQVMYTSGTTGDPKGIVVPHGRFVAATEFGESMFNYRAGDRPYTGLSLTHGNAQFVTLAPSLAMELGAVISRKFTKSRLWDIIRRYQCTSFSMLGGMATAIYSEPRCESDFDNPVRHVVSAGMSADIWEDFCHRFNVEVIEFYGAMEGGLLLNPMGVGPIGSCGKPPPMFNIRIVNENYEDVPVGQEGELLFGLADGTPINVEYLGLPEASAKKTKDGWLCSGDVVSMDDHGWIYYRYRLGGGLRHNGDFINPLAIEKVLAESPLVRDVFVWGVPSASGSPGEKDVVATVVLENQNEKKYHELFFWCRSKLEANMVPSYIQIVSEIPKTASEKPQERFLREAFENCKGLVITELQTSEIDTNS